MTTKAQNRGVVNLSVSDDSRHRLVDSAAPVDADETADLKKLVALQDSTIFEMRTLLDSGKGLSNILRLNPLLDTCMAIVRERYGVRNAAVLLKDDLDPSRELFAIRAFCNLEPEYIDPSGRKESLYLFKLPKDNGLLWQIIMQGKVFSIRDLQGEPRFRVAFEKWNLGVLNSEVWCPFIKSGEVLGILALGKPENNRSISESDYPFLQEFASISTTSIDSTIKYEKNERILKNIRTLYDVNQQLNNVNDFKRLCRETLAKALDAVGAQKGNLMLLNPATNMLEIKVVWGMIPDHVRDGINNGTMETNPVAMGETVAGKCALNRKAVRVNNKDEIPSVGKFETLCICSVPVLEGERVEGVINMTNKVRRGPEGEWELDPLGRFTEEDLNLLMGLADQAATGLKKARLYSDSITDRMTGLYNTRHFEEVLAKEFARSQASGKPMCLAVSDVDHFKKFNDTHGHKAGDAVLQEIARIFSQSRRSDRDDMAFRYGGEEYCLVMPETTPDEAALLVETFRKRVESTPVLYEGKSLNVTCSIGVASSILDTNDPKELFKLADECLYACKANGRNQVRVYLAGAKTRVEDGFDKTAMQIYLARQKKDSAPK